GGDANWQTEPGILVTGKMRSFDWDTWQSYSDSLKNSAKPGAMVDLSILRGVNLSARKIKILGQEIQNAQVDMRANKDSWNIRLNSNEIIGQIILPFDLSSQAIQGRFQRFHLAAPNQNDQKKMDPRSLPAMLVES